MNALQGLGLFNAIRIVWSYLHARLYPNPVEENFEQWVSNRFGKRLYQIFFNHRHYACLFQQFESSSCLYLCLEQWDNE